MPYTSMTFELYLSGAWVNVTSDVLSGESVRVRYGNWDHGPTARVAQTGSMQFSLDNSAQNSGGVAGYYSPGHASVRAGFGRGVRVRLTVTHSATPYVKFLGKLVEVRPEPGVKRSRRTYCVALDWMDELAMYMASDVSPQAAVYADEIIDAIVTSMPTDTQPLTATDLSPGLDQFAYALHDLQPGESALTAVNKAVMSELGYLDMKGSGALTYRNRQHAPLAASAATFTDSPLSDIRVSGTLSTSYNKIIVTSHPKDVDTAAVVVWQHEGTGIQFVPAQRSYFWVNFTDPDNVRAFIGIVPGSGITPVSAVDWVANRLQDGSGDDYTIALDVVQVDWFATSAKIEVFNISGSVVYLTTLQLRAKGIYDLTPQTYRASSTQVYGDRPISIDLPYQDNAEMAQGFADYLLDQYDALTRQVEEIEFMPHAEGEAKLLEALTLEPGSVVTVSETVTGLSSSLVRVMGVELELQAPKNILRCRLSTEPVFSYAGTVWILDDATYSVLGTTTELGVI